MTQPASTFTRGPNWTYALLGVTTPAEYKVLSACVRITYGWNEEWSEATAGEIAELTNLQRSTVSTIFAKFAAVGLIERTTGRRNSYRWRLQEVTPDQYELSPQPTAQNVNCLPTRQQAVASADNKLSPQPTPYIRKKERVKTGKKESAVADATPAASNQPESPDHVSQPALIGLPEPPTPGSAAPPSPAKARKPRTPKASPEQAAIRQALRDAAGWGPSAKANAQAAENGDALMELDEGATPERIRLFARRWFPKYSPIARAAAARQDTASNPTPGQVLQFWPGFQEWERAQRAAAERARQEEPPRPDEISAEQRQRNREKIQEAMRGLLGGHSASTATRPAMAALGRAT